LHYFLLIKINGKTFKTLGTILGWNPARSYSARRGGLPGEADRSAGWATAWRPDPTKEVAHSAGAGARAGRACGVVTARWPRVGRQGGAVGPRAPADKVSQKRWREHCEGGGNALDEVAAVRAHPSSGSTCEGRAEAARRFPTVAEALRSQVAPVVGSYSAGGEGRG
jgi:hypothetical protein